MTLTQAHATWLTEELSTIRDRTSTLWSDSIDYRDHSISSVLRAKLLYEQLNSVVAQLSIIAQAHEKFLIETEVLTNDRIKVLSIDEALNLTKP